MISIKLTNFLKTFLKNKIVGFLINNCLCLFLGMLNPLALSIVKNHIQSLKTEHRYGRPQRLTTDYVLNRIAYVLRTGCQWSALPVTGGCWKTIYHYFSTWSKAHIFERAQRDLIRLYTKRGFSKEVVVDTSFVKNVWGRDCLGKSPVDRGRKATKVSVMTDVIGTPLYLLFHPGNRNDSRTLPHLLNKTSKHIVIEGKTIYADKIYDSTYCKDAILRHKLQNKVSKKNSSPNKVDNRTRIVVEHCFAWLDKFRRIILRYDGLVCHFRSFHYLAVCHILSTRLH